MAKTIHIATYGCQMNDYESDRTFRLFHDAHGYEWTDDPGSADVVLFNTCSIRDKADQKAISEIGTLRTSKAERPDMIIAVGGCLAQMQGDELRKRFPYVDIVFGTHQWNKLPDLVQKVSRERARLWEVDLHGWRDYSFLSYHVSSLAHPVAELVTVQNGCDKFCTFCLVPFTRGRQVSRPHEEILGEVRSLVERGVGEVMLLGQNVNAYGEDRSGEIGFPSLLRRVAAVPDLKRIRFVTSHPSNLTPELIDTMADEGKICAHLHLPVQSGSDRLLERMRRDYTAEQYRTIVRNLRERVRGISVTTDFIVGFPSESDGDFESTLRLLRDIEFDDSFSFKFSPRPRTKAGEWSDDFVPEPVADERLRRLQAAQTEIRERKMVGRVGETVEVLVEGGAKKGTGFLAGKTSQNRWVNFPGPQKWVGTLRRVEIRESLSNSFRGVPEEEEL